MTAGDNPRRAGPACGRQARGDKPLPYWTKRPCTQELTRGERGPTALETSAGPAAEDQVHVAHGVGTPALAEGFMLLALPVGLGAEPCR